MREVHLVAGAYTTCFHALQNFLFPFSLAEQLAVPSSGGRGAADRKVLMKPLGFMQYVPTGGAGDVLLQVELME